MNVENWVLPKRNKEQFECCVAMCINVVGSPMWISEHVMHEFMEANELILKGLS